jgi:diadenosine tetraphosphate (Ap4A) HIT family hydrolase
MRTVGSYYVDDCATLRGVESMTYDRAPWDTPTYLERVRRACFICELVTGNPDYPHHVVYRDEQAIAFMNKYPTLWGHVLVAPTSHREHVVADFEVAEYLGLQRVVHAVGRAVAAVVPTERLYVFSLGSQQGNRHVHWHIAPMPPGVPYDQQQVAALAADTYLDVPDRAIAVLAERIATHLP